MLDRPATPHDLPSLRVGFPGAAKWTYLDTAARGLLSVDVRAAMDAHTDERMFDGGDKPPMFAALEAARAGMARLLRCEPDEVAVTKNISEGLNVIAASYPWRRGDNVVLCLDKEHPNNVYPWLNQARRSGITIKAVESVDGHIPAEAIIAAIDGSTRIVTAPTTSFLPGFRTDLDAIGAACRSRDVLFLVDAAQSAGIIDHDMSATPVDAMAISTQKGLLGLYGMGFLYVRRAWAERIEPIYLARFGVDLGDAHEADLGAKDFAFMPGARRFDLGNANFPAAVAVGASLSLLELVGTAAIERHAVGLARSLSDQLAALGLPLWQPPHDEAWASIVTLGKSETDVPVMAALAEALSAADVKFSIRQNRLRFSFHLYNSADDVGRVAAVAEDFLRTQRIHAAK